MDSGKMKKMGQIESENGWDEGVYTIKTMYTMYITAVGKWGIGRSTKRKTWDGPVGMMVVEESKREGS